MAENKPAIAPDLVSDFVTCSHGDFERVRELLAEEPALVNACWDWGGGDWETGFGAAAHVGRRDIAMYLLDRGARIDSFAAAMLGKLDVVRAAVADNLSVVNVKGPHGIPLIVHAKERGRGGR